MSTDSSKQAASLNSVCYKRGSLSLLDQRKLPFEVNYIHIRNSEDGWHAIKDMIVRGAPAIALAAALSLAIEVYNIVDFDGTPADAAYFIRQKMEYLISSRPTAVNISDMARKLEGIISNVATIALDTKTIFEAYVEACEAMLENDISSNKEIGRFGMEALLNKFKNKNSRKLSILTHCNTGSLATAGYGTALGVIRSLHIGGVLERAYCTETRPFNQGSRLTAFELVHDGIPATLITDSAVASLMKSGLVDAVVVGADRVASNGDTANKIGTYNIALSAAYHNIPFYVAAPSTSFDLSISSGNEVVIEERSAKEISHSHGGLGEQVAAFGISVWNPAFDVTPSHLITGIITEKGIVERKGDVFDIKGFQRLFC